MEYLRPAQFSCSASGITSRLERKFWMKQLANIRATSLTENADFEMASCGCVMIDFVQNKYGKGFPFAFSGLVGKLRRVFDSVV